MANYSKSWKNWRIWWWFNLLLEVCSAAFLGSRVIHYITHTNNSPDDFKIPIAIINAADFSSKWLWVPTVIYFFTKIASKYIKKQPQQNADAIKALLDHFQLIHRPEGTVNYRVTLYEYKKGAHKAKWYRYLSDKPRNLAKKDYTGSLVIFERSGNFGRQSKTKWPVSLNRKSIKCGVAGAAFSSDDAILVEELEDLASLKKTKNRQTKRIAAYAKATFLSDEETTEKILAKSSDDWSRSFWGDKVFVGSNLWGILLIDSTDPKIPSGEYFQQNARMVLEMLDVMLKERTKE